METVNLIGPELAEALSFFLDFSDLMGLLKRFGLFSAFVTLPDCNIVLPFFKSFLNFLREQSNAQSGVSLISPGLLVARLIASTGYELRQMLVPIINKMTDENLPKTWRL